MNEFPPLSVDETVDGLGLDRDLDLEISKRQQRPPQSLTIEEAMRSH